MYQRQVWKQLLSNKVLLDPKTSRFFKTSDLHDLFSLQESTDSHPETANIFHDSRVRIQENIKRKKKEKHKKKKCISDDLATGSGVQFTEDKIQAMKDLAQQIAKSLSQKKEEPPVPKTSYQLELEEERQRKLKEKEELKKLTAQELLLYNKEKAKQIEDEAANKIDDFETEASFEKALEYSETAAKLHHVLNSGKIQDPEVVKKQVVDIRKDIAKVDISEISKDSVSSTDQNGSNATLGSWTKESKKYKKAKHRINLGDKSVIDDSGTIDGERVEGLVKRELKKNKKKKKRKNDEKTSDDDFVLGKLFSKRGK